MLQKQIKEESGMAMPLAMMMVVLVGVMGAGLLTFVTRDLDSVIESNQGQTAFNLADAGVQAAKSHLLEVDASNFSYDGITNLSTDPPNPADSNWSCGVWVVATQTCTAAGRSLTLDPPNNNNVRVWIQYLRPALTATDANDATGVYAPAVATSSGNYPSGEDYFKVISQGTVGQTKRKVEAIFKTNANSLGLPRGIYTPGNITLSGAAGNVTNMSLFAGGNITGRSDFVRGIDYAYGDWNRAPNTTPRSGVPSCPNPLKLTDPQGPCAGYGAAGTVQNKVSLRDYDGTTAACPSRPQFRRATDSLTAPCTTRMTFPFNAASPDIDALRYAAQSQVNGIGGDNYYSINPSSNQSIVNAATGLSGPVWPTDNRASTVVFVEFVGTPRQLNWSLANSLRCDQNPEPVRGTLVVVNGTFNVQQNMTPLRGMVIVSGAGPGTEVYKSAGSPCMQSFIAASGDIQIAGNVGNATQERGAIPTNYNLGLVSWRELYK